MQKTYYLDLKVLLPLLQGKSGYLTTDLVIKGKRGKGHIELQKGALTACSIQFENGTFLTNDRAYTELASITQWKVELSNTEAQPLLNSDFPSPNPTNPLQVLQRKKPIQNELVLLKQRQLDQSYFKNLPHRKYLILNMVLSLINGKRTCNDIKTHLHVSSQDIDEAIQQLNTLGIISYERTQL